MKSIALSFVALAAMAGSASADFLPTNHGFVPSELLTATPIGSIDPSRDIVVYSSIPGPYLAPAAAAFAHRDDYETNLGGTGTFKVDSIRFVGGVAAAGGILDFFFLDDELEVLSSFAVQLPEAGNFIWSIGPFATPHDAGVSGHFQIQTREGTTGQWFATDTPADPGSNSFSSGYGSTFTPASIGAFEIIAVPSPGAAALFILGGAIAARRRR